MLISNHDTPVTRRLYHAAGLERPSVRRSISRDGQNRGVADEILALFGGDGL